MLSQDLAIPILGGRAPPRRQAVLLPGLRRLLVVPARMRRPGQQPAGEGNPILLLWRGDRTRGAKTVNKFVLFSHELC